MPNELSPEQVAQLEVGKKEKVLAIVRKWVEDGIDFGIAADFDANISRSEGGPNAGLDPRLSYLDPVAKEAFSQMIENGKDVVIISSRGTADLEGIVQIPGVGFVGTLGWETRMNGVSFINPIFDPFQPQITAILGDVEDSFLREQLGIQEKVPNQPNIALPTPDGGEIILQVKGYNDKFPRGINHTYSLNLVSPEARQHYLRALETYYKEAFDKQTRKFGPAEAERLAQLSKFMVRTGRTTEGLPTLDAEIRPGQEGAKRRAIVQLMRSPDDPKRQSHFKKMPYDPNWIYSGDHPIQDAPVMRAEHLAERISGNRLGGLGIWSKPEHEGYQNVPGVDLVVNSVGGNAQLQLDIAKIIRTHSRNGGR